MEYLEEMKIANEMARKFGQMREDIQKTFGKDINEYILGDEKPYLNRNYKELPDSFGKKLRLHLENGGMPSEFFKKNIKKFNGYIPEELLPYFYRSLDTVNEWQVSWSNYYRRSYRAKNDYTLYLERFLDIINSYSKIANYGYDISDLVKENVSEEMMLYIKHKNRWFLSDYYIAAKLDEGDEKLEEALTDVLYGEAGSVNPIHIRGIVMSHNEKMFELLGKTLFAAKLSEGLRQVICENMDFGTKEAFLYLLKVIQDNDLIRFSSVKRAIATFTGLFAYDSKDIDRISDKTLSLIGKALSDDGAIEELLSSEDSMEIYIALWAICFVDVQTAFERAKKLALEGSRHQRLVACYFVAHSGVPFVTNDFAKNIVRNYSDDDENLAIVMNIFMAAVGTSLYRVLYPKNYNRYKSKDEKFSRVYADYSDFFESPEECREFNDILYGVLDRLPKKGQRFEPCVFPWYVSTLSPSDIVVRIVFCASALKDQELILKAAGMFKDISSGSGHRTKAIEILLREPDTPELLDILTQEMSDADSSCREVAFRILKQELKEDRSGLPGELAAPAGRLPERSYMILEDMLRLKRADLRNNVLGLLMTRGPEEKIEMLERLFKDGKEEKVTAGLDILMQMKKSDEPTFKDAADTIKYIEKPTTKEKILIDEINGASSADGDTKQELFYDVNATYEPVIDEDYLAEATQAFYKLFPDSKAAEVISSSQNFASKLKNLFSAGSKKKASEKEALGFVEELDDLIEANKDREYNIWNGPTLLGNMLTREYVNGKVGELPFLDLWDSFWDTHEISDGQLLSLYYIYKEMHYNETIFGYLDHFKPVFVNLFGPIFASKKFNGGKHRNQVYKVLSHYIYKRNILKENNRYIAAITMLYLNRTKESLEYTFTKDKYKNEWNKRSAEDGVRYKKSILDTPIIEEAMMSISMDDRNFPIHYAFYNGVVQKLVLNKSLVIRDYGSAYSSGKLMGPHPLDYIRAAKSEIITKDFMYKSLMAKGNIKESLSHLSNLAKFIYESDITVSTRTRGYSWYGGGIKSSVSTLLKTGMEDVKRENLSEDDEKILALAEECYEKICGFVMNTELVRGDTETDYSSASLSLNRVYGVEYLIRILGALGEETLDRSSYFYAYSNRSISKRESLSHLLSICIPDPREGDAAAQAEKLKSLVKGTDIKESRLIEAGLYSPEWLPIVGEYLGWEGFMSGCYYFMAHMNEKFDDKRAAIIAKYTPLNEQELNDGAFDINWFNEVYKTLGKKRFDAIYKAAKYISDGGKHTRARKYADAARGEMDPAKTAEDIEKKRNKDLLMAYALIPCKEKEKKDRYAFIQKYMKESKKFGAQRRASEKAAAEMAIKNMAIASGFSDETRFVLKMEREIASGLSMYFEPHEVDGYLVSLSPDDAGKLNFLIKKGDKTLKAVPAGIKKKDYIVDITEAKKTFTEQYRRTRIMMEEAMESETEFFVSEILDMSTDPVIGPMINKLLFKQGDFLGFPDDIRTAELEGKTTVLVAHPYHLYKAGRWHEFQKICYDRQIKQPFKQIFRELYVKTDEERDVYESRRYAGNQINPKQTVGVLRNRRWIADAEAGLQKVYYKEDIIATIYALADWFSPSDIEAPTLEWVCFYDRKTFERKLISEIPDIIFSEVMRDVDLAVSVAHAGEIDPEMSHSTIEMRRAIAEFVVPMFKLKNVTFTDSHALVKGERGSYNIHLGSGVIHQEGGPMINVLPVHSQHRGRIFLPFVDDDPKTAEIMSKIIFFAEDKKIKDPFILNQIV